MPRSYGAALDARFERAKRSAYWRDEDARAVLDAWLASGQSVAVFSAEHGLQRARLHRWKQRLMPDMADEVAALFWPVKVAAEPSRPTDVESWRVSFSTSCARLRARRRALRV